MIKVNLLDSVTDRARSAGVVEQKVTDPRTRFWLLGACVFALMACGMAFDFVSANAENSRVKAELEKQEQIAAQMAAINKEQAELEKKIKEQLGIGPQVDVPAGVDPVTGEVEF